jgi:hypothetical protein
VRCRIPFNLPSLWNSTAKIPEALPVDTPSSTVQTKLPETDLATLTVGVKESVLTPERKRNRLRTLELMSEI